MLKSSPNGKKSPNLVTLALLLSKWTILLLKPRSTMLLTLNLLSTSQARNFVASFRQRRLPDWARPKTDKKSILAHSVIIILDC